MPADPRDQEGRADGGDHAESTSAPTIAYAFHLTVPARLISPDCMALQAGKIRLNAINGTASKVKWSVELVRAAQRRE